MGRDPPQYRRIQAFVQKSSGGAQKSKYKLDHFQLGGVENCYRTGPCKASGQFQVLYRSH